MVWRGLPASPKCTPPTVETDGDTGSAGHTRSSGTVQATSFPADLGEPGVPLLATCVSTALMPGVFSSSLGCSTISLSYSGLRTDDLGP